MNLTQFEWIQKNIQKGYIMKCKSFLNKLTSYKMLVCNGGEWKKKEMRGREKKDGKKGGSVKKWENRNVCLIIDVSVKWNPST